MNASILSLADRVVVRLVVRRWLELLALSAAPLFIALIVLLFGLRLGQVEGLPLFGAQAIGTGVGLVVAWLVGAGVWAWVQRPGPITAMAAWDEAAGHDEMFLSAYCFVTAGQDSPAVQVHLDRASRQLPEASKNVGQDLPWRLHPAVVIVPILFLSLSATPFFKQAAIAGPGGQDEEELSDAALSRADEVGDTIVEEAKGLEKSKLGLNEEEAKKLDNLRKQLADSADKMKGLGKQESSRKILEELEKRAREAEKLAEALGQGQEHLSKGMLAELERHADTADLAGALRGNRLRKAAIEAFALGGKLESADLTNEARTRIQTAFGKGLEAATPEDKKSSTGKALAASKAHLDKKANKLAGAELKKLSQVYTKRAQRQRARRKLKQLAKNLRQAGQKVFGNKQGRMRKLAKVQSRRKMRRVNALPPKLLPWQGQNQPGNGPPPSEEPLPEDGPQKLIPLTPENAPPPVPGGKPPGGKWPKGKGAGPPVPGGPGGGPWRNPVPGGGPGGKPGGAPVPGAGPGGNGGGAGQGGNKPGGGAAPFGKNNTKPMEAKRTGVVEGAKSRGESMARTMDPRYHREGSSRSTSSIARKFLKSEEEALADEPLPVSRREQVLRYFTAIRKQLEAAKAAEGEK